MLQISIVLTSMWRLDDMRATLRCHPQVCKSVHTGTAAHSTATCEYKAELWAEEW